MGPLSGLSLRGCKIPFPYMEHGIWNCFLCVSDVSLSNSTEAGNCRSNTASGTVESIVISGLAVMQISVGKSEVIDNSSYRMKKALRGDANTARWL